MFDSTFFVATNPFTRLILLIGKSWRADGVHASACLAELLEGDCFLTDAKRTKYEEQKR